VPFVPRLFVKTGIAYLVATFVAGAAFLVLEAMGRGVPFIVTVEHGHAGFVGWIVNTVIGVALWLLPLNRSRFPLAQGRYPETVAVAAYAALNVGLVMRLVCEPWFVLAHAPAASVLLVVSAVLQLLGIALAAWILWQRVFPPPLRPTV
jgi:hypothetical protein